MTSRLQIESAEVLDAADLAPVPVRVMLCGSWIAADLCPFPGLGTNRGLCPLTGARLVVAARVLSASNDHLHRQSVRVALSVSENEAMVRAP